MPYSRSSSPRTDSQVQSWVLNVKKRQRQIAELDALIDEVKPMIEPL